MNESKETQTVNEDSGIFESFNQWLLSLPRERTAILREDKWMLAEAAFAAGRAVGRQETDRLIEYSYIALREDDGSPWAGQYFEVSGCRYAHDKAISKAYGAKSVKALHSAMIKQLCDYGGVAQSIGCYSIFKVAKGEAVERIASDVVPIVLKNAQWKGMAPDFASTFYADMMRSLVAVVDHRPSAEDIARAWNHVCGASHVFEVEVPTGPSKACDLKVEMKDAVKKLGAAIRDGAVATDGAVELRRIAEVVVLLADAAGVPLKARGFATRV
jgi:hypothetical protein